MAIYKLFPTKDATLYSAFQHMNTGLDPIIESTTDFINSRANADNGTNGQDPQVSRFLIEFDLNEILNVIDTTASGSTTKSFLRVFNANSRGLTSTTTLLVNAIGQNWNMGTGTYLPDPIIKNGCCWKNTLSQNEGTWNINTPSSGITGSDPSGQGGGGSWYTASATTPQNSQSFDYYSSLDLNVDVTQIVTNWSSSLFTNYGFIVRQSESQEFVNNVNSQTELKFFSRDTNTIYPPQLEIKWDDFTWDTGSSSTTELTTTEALLSLTNNKSEYYPEEVAKLKVNAIEKYPPRTFLTSSGYTKNFYLPSGSSLYAIKDSKTNEYVIDFDSDYTKISADENGSYFNIYMNGLEPERYYTALVQITINGETKVFDSDLDFKVIEG